MDSTHTVRYRCVLHNLQTRQEFTGYSAELQLQAYGGVGVVRMVKEGWTANQIVLRMPDPTHSFSWWEFVPHPMLSPTE